MNDTTGSNLNLRHWKDQHRKLLCKFTKKNPQYCKQIWEINPFKCNIISLLHGGRLTSQPPSQPTGPPSPPACHSSWSNRTAPSSGLVSDLTHTQMQTHIRSTLISNEQCFLGVTNVILVITIISRTVHQAGDWPLIVRVGEKYQLLVDKVVVGEGLGGLTIQVVLWRDQRYSET